MLIVDVMLNEEDYSWQQEVFESASMSHDDLTGSSDITWTSSMCDHQFLFFQRSKYTYDRRSLRSLPASRQCNLHLSLNDRARGSWPLAGCKNDITNNISNGSSKTGRFIQKSCMFNNKHNNEPFFSKDSNDPSFVVYTSNEKRLPEEVFCAAIEINGQISPSDHVVESDSDSCESALERNANCNNLDEAVDNELRFVEAFALTPELLSLAGESSVDASPAVESVDFIVSAIADKNVNLSNDCGHLNMNTQLEVPGGVLITECFSSSRSVLLPVVMPADMNNQTSLVLQLAPPSIKLKEVGNHEMIANDNVSFSYTLSTAVSETAASKVEQAASGTLHGLGLGNGSGTITCVDINQHESIEPQSQWKDATIYAQANSDMVLVLLMDEDSKPLDKPTVRAVVS